MKWTDSTGKVTMYTSGAGFTAGTKTLIISSHGALRGTTFGKPYPCVIKFALPKGGALIAGLIDVIKGNVTDSEISLGGQKQQDDYNISHYEHDPTSLQIQNALAGNTNYDVLVLEPGKHMTLSTLLSWLNQWNLKYPGILCIFCRVKGGEYFTVHGKKSKSVQQLNMQQVMATAIALELKAKGKAT